MLSRYSSGLCGKLIQNEVTSISECYHFSSPFLSGIYFFYHTYFLPIHSNFLSPSLSSPFSHTHSLPADYPCAPPVFEIEANQSGSFSFTHADKLYDLLMKESYKRVGRMMIFELVAIAQEHMLGMSKSSILTGILPSKPKW